MFSAPYAVGVQRADGSVSTTGHLKPGGWTGVFNALRGQPGGWAGLVQTRSDGTVLRALSPLHTWRPAALPANAMDDYINRVWQEVHDLDPDRHAVRGPAEHQVLRPGLRENVMNFTNSSGAVVTSFQKPDAAECLRLPQAAGRTQRQYPRAHLPYASAPVSTGRRCW